MPRFAWKAAGWFVKLLPLLALGLFLHYYLPQHDVVRIVETDVKRMDTRGQLVTESGQQPGVVTRDVRFVNAVWPDGRPRVYRNEETGWGFPWYFKFDSQNLATKAQDLRSTGEDPRWVRVTYYGWRIEMLSMFPNAVGLTPVASVDDTVFPWFNVAFFVGLAGLLFGAWILWRRFVELHWKPFLKGLEIDERFENGANAASQVWRWLKAGLRDRLDRLTGRRGPGGGPV